jgi:hypothetical protein
MFSSQAPKRLWDDCIKLKQCVQSDTWNECFANRGKVPETIVSGETADISTFAQHHWYEWIMFRDTSVSFLGDKLVLGCYLGPSIDVGRPAMTAKLLKANGVIIHRSTYRSLTDIEQVSEEHKKLHLDFDAQVKNKLGKGHTAADLVAKDVESPTYDLYANDISGKQCHAVDQEEEVTPEGGHEYINASVTLPQGDSQIDARVIARKHDAVVQVDGSSGQWF